MFVYPIWAYIADSGRARRTKDSYSYFLNSSSSLHSVSVLVYGLRHVSSWFMILGVDRSLAVSVSMHMHVAHCKTESTYLLRICIGLYE